MDGRVGMAALLAEEGAPGDQAKEATEEEEDSECTSFVVFFKLTVPTNAKPTTELAAPTCGCGAWP